MNETLEAQSKKLIQVAAELENAAAHARIAADHFKSGEVPRGCAHAFATKGHMAVASETLSLVAIDHRLKAKLQ